VAEDDNQMKSKRDHISVCICTYRRPNLLEHLLSILQDQETGELFSYSIVVVDNDRAHSAMETVDAFKETSPLEVEYYNVPEQNISMARNKAVESANGNFVAFIDDDEFPANNWLLNMYETLNNNNASGVLGPVKPHFEVAPPQWIIRGNLCERDAFDTGTVLRNHIYTRTGNVLFAKQIFNEGDSQFNPIYGRTGGEDVDFFKRMIERGHVFVWCNEATVFETVPPERLTRGYFLKRALMRGVVNSKNASFISFDILKSIVAFILYTMTLPLLLLIGHHLFMRYLIKDCDHIGKLLGLCGLELVKDRGFAV